MPERSPAEVKLERILYILAAANRADGARLTELAAALGITEAEVLADLEEATARAYNHPAGTVDTFQILAESDRVHVWSTIGPLRPVRLSAGETLALGLGLRMLAAEAEPGRQAGILALAHRLERALASPAEPPMPSVREGPADEIPYLASRAPSIAEPSFAGVAEDDDVAYHLAVGEDEIRALLAQAATERLRCRVAHIKPGDIAPTDRLIAPQLLIYAEGIWYVLAHDRGRDAYRTFRLDRILEAELTDQTFEPPVELDVDAFIRDGRVYAADEDVTARVRYSPRIARWMLERRPPDAQPQPDGSVVLAHPVADPRWLVQHVLQYGPDAEVLDPPELRGAVAAAVSRWAAR
jgi:predicted DNA-binding transcriptional regulator YafY